MISSKKNLITPIPLGIIPNYRSYWATQFYSILQCLDAHKILKYSPMNLTSFPIYTLAVLRGSSPVNFFNEIENYIKNWGIQYFLVNYFNQKLSENVVLELITRIENSYNVKFSRDLEYFSFHVSGNDSALSTDLRGSFSKVFPSNLNGQFANVDDLIAYSDICLVLKNYNSQVKVGIFGEIEGLHGNKLRNEKYWRNKQDFCIFGIGVVGGHQRGVYFCEKHINGICKINLLFERTNFVVQDFYFALYAIKQLFLEGPSAQNRTRDEEFNFFFNEIKKYWNTDIQDLLANLRQYLSPDDLVGFNDGDLQIITDFRSAPKTQHFAQPGLPTAAGKLGR
jgi:hypothetical protein